MNKFLLMVIVVLTYTALSATGLVLDRNASQLRLLNLASTTKSVDINNQIAVVTVTDVFRNTSSSSFNTRYYFPMQEGASPTKLTWCIHDVLYTANIAGNPQNPQGGPSNLPQYFTNYVGGYPVVFDFDEFLEPEETMIVELTYVQLLPYEYGNVTLDLKNDYQAIQTTALENQFFSISLVSDRPIESFITPGMNFSVNFNEHYITTSLSIDNQPANQDVHAVYSTTQDELAFTALSGVFDAPDELGDGFITFIAEPENNTSEYIEKVFTLIIDRSGSMYGDKMTQAREAARYIVNNLNEGDKFNLIDFDDAITSLWTSHQLYTVQTRQEALTYINTLSARGMTNISGAFGTAIPQFSNSNPNVANIIIFFTDGQATEGITETEALVSFINGLVVQHEVEVSIFNFGIGNDANAQLLMNLAVQNNGIATFLGNNELQSVITDFYDSIRYPVMLSPIITVTPANAITEIYPNPLPNVYQGHQLIVSGRYHQSQPVQITFSGSLYGETVAFPYNVDLSDSSSTQLNFLPKIWAKQKIESMIIQYYLLNPYSLAAISLREQIVQLSIAYGVVCEFTSFSGGEVSTEDEFQDITPACQAISLLGNFPNPFNPSTAIRFELKEELKGPVFIKIYNIKGQLVRTLGLHVNHKGIYEIVWDGMDQTGNLVSSGSYFYTLIFDNYLLSGKMTMMK
jgi:Ca-activated chloride channel family protein